MSLRREPPGNGFTLVELLIVIAIMSILLTAVGPVFTSLTSSQSPSTVATAVASQLEKARGYAVAKNTYVWIRIGKVAEEPFDLYIAVFESLDGTDTPAEAQGAWRAPSFVNFKISDQLDGNFKRPDVPAADRLNEATWIRFNPAGEAWILPAVGTQSRIKMKPPTDPGKLARLTEIGLQPIRRGIVSDKAKRNVAAVHLVGLTGQTLEYAP